MRAAAPRMRALLDLACGGRAQACAHVWPARIRMGMRMRRAKDGCALVPM